MKKIIVVAAIAAASINLGACALEATDLLNTQGNKNATDWKKSVYDTEGREGHGAGNGGGKK